MSYISIITSLSCMSIYITCRLLIYDAALYINSFPTCLRFEIQSLMHASATFFWGFLCGLGKSIHLLGCPNPELDTLALTFTMVLYFFGVNDRNIFKLFKIYYFDLQIKDSYDNCVLKCIMKDLFRSALLWLFYLIIFVYRIRL